MPFKLNVDLHMYHVLILLPFEEKEFATLIVVEAQHSNLSLSKFNTLNVRFFIV